MWQGAPDVKYSTITPSDLEAPPPDWVLDKFSLTAGKHIGVNATLTFVGNSKSVATRPDCYNSNLLTIGERNFVLCDVYTRKSWLVNGLSTLLHLVRRHLTYAENHELHRSMSKVKASDLKAEGGRNGPLAALETLRSDSNKALRLYFKGETSKKTKTEYRDEDFYCLKDLVKDIMEFLEKSLDHQSDTRSRQENAGYRIKASPWEQLEGFDFMDIATKTPNISPRAVRLRADGKEWAKLTRALKAPTLFGKHFGDILEPIDTETTSKGCSVCHWNEKMPPERDLLAVRVEDLLTIGTKDGSRLSFPEGLCLDVKSVLFEPCTATGCQDSDRIQKLQRASGNAQKRLLAKVFPPMKVAGGEAKDRHAEVQSSSPTSIPSDGAILLGMPQEPSKLFSQLRRRNLKRTSSHSAQSLSCMDDPRVAASSTRSDDATPNYLNSESLGDQTVPSDSGENVYSAEDTTSQPSSTDYHRQKRAKSRAEKGRATFQNKKRV